MEARVLMGEITTQGAHQPWHLSWRTDPRGRVVADRHYNRQSIGAQDFVPPGRCLVLLTESADALWITSWPYAEYVQHDWAGAWMNSAFRNEGSLLSSDLIRAAVAATRYRWPEPPALGMVTFVDPTKVRRKRDPGRCYRKAGFRHVGYTKAGLLAFQMLPDDMPTPEAAWGSTLELTA
jgi:hypothetical protein